MTTKRSGAARCRRKFLRFFPQGFRDETYIDWERGYKSTAHERWEKELGQAQFRSFIQTKKFAEIARSAVTIESRTNLLFSFEKMAIRDAIKSGDRALEPMVTKRAADEYDFPFVCSSRPAWETYSSLLEFGARVNKDMRDLEPRDLIDAQGFIWVQGSDEYD